MKKSSYTTVSSSRQQIEQICQQHDGEYFTNFCSSIQCIRPLCPECVQKHYDFHKQLESPPEMESFKTVKQRCLRKLKQILQRINEQTQNYGINKNSQFSKLYELSLKKLKQCRQNIEKIIKTFFLKCEESLKKKINILVGDHEITKIMETSQNIIKQIQLLSKNIDNSNSLIQNIVKTLKLDQKRLIGKIVDDYKKIKQTKQKSEIILSIQKNLESNFASLLNKSIYFTNYDDSQLNQLLNNLRTSNRVNADLTQSQSNSNSREKNKKNIQQENYKKYKKQLSQSESQKAYSYNQTKNKSILQKSKPKKQINIIGLNTFKQQSKRKYLHFFQNDDNFLHLLDLNGSSNQFEQIKLDIGFKIPYFHKSISTPNGDLYLIGGTIPQSVIKSQKIYKYDFQTNSLTYCANLKYGRSSHALCFNNKYIYIVGGFLNNQVVTSKSQRFDIVNNKIQEIESCHHPVNSLCLASFNGRYIFKFGGNGPSKQIVHYIQKYDQKKNNWQVLNPIFQGITKDFFLLSTSAALQITPNDIMVMGGYDENNEGYKQTYIFSIQNQNYTIKQINQYPLPYGEGFWNNNPIIQNKVVFALQNLGTRDKEDCIENDRRILSFNGLEWKVI